MNVSGHTLVPARTPGLLTMLKRTLRRYGRAYGQLQHGYYRCRSLLERYVFGSRLQEWRWRLRGTWRRGGDIEGSWSSRSHPHRSLLLERVAGMSPFVSVLEIGCGGGANLANLTERFPGARLFGVDLNLRALTSARQGLGTLASPSTLSIAEASDLRSFADRSVDVVLSDAVLMYVGPDRISKAIGEIVRVMRRGAVLVEWHTALEATGPQPSQDHFAHWIHDYQALFARHGCANVRVTKLPPEAWEDAGWRAFGAVIEVDSAGESW